MQSLSVVSFWAVSGWLDRQIKPYLPLYRERFALPESTLRVNASTRNTVASFQKRRLSMKVLGRYYLENII